MTKLPPPSRLDRAISYFAPRYGLRRRTAQLSLSLLESSSSRYRGSDKSRLRQDWLTAGLTTATPSPWELDLLRQRSRDLNCNDPVASGATDTLTLNVAGQGLMPQSRLRADLLGLSEEEAQKLRRQIENVFQIWMKSADAAQRYDFQEMQFLALRKIIEDGEIIVLPVFLSEKWRPLGRALELIEGHRLVSPAGRQNVIQGVELGPERHQPVRYWLQKAAKLHRDYEISSQDLTGVPARDANGRPMVLHLFPAKRPGQIRGIPYFAPVLTYFKDLADYLEAEVVAARVAACLAVFITKADPMYEAQLRGTAYETGTGKRLEHIEPGLVSYLNVGENIQTVDPKRGGETFNAFVEGILRIIGISLGLPYELLVKDFSKTNYSSARAALLEGRRLFLQWRSWFARKFCQPVYELVLEEAYLRGLVALPNFYRDREEYCRAQWIGGSWGWVDPVKEVEASKKAIDYGLSTQAKEAAAQGEDWEELLEQRRREQQRASELGLDLSLAPTPGAGRPPQGEENDAETQTR